MFKSFSITGRQLQFSVDMRGQGEADCTIIKTIDQPKWAQFRLNPPNNTKNQHSGKLLDGRIPLSAFLEQLTHYSFLHAESFGPKSTISLKKLSEA